MSKKMNMYPLDYLRDRLEAKTLRLGVDGSDLVLYDYTSDVAIASALDISCWHLTPYGKCLLHASSTVLACKSQPLKIPT